MTALDKTIEMWKWLAKTGKTKKEYFEWFPYLKKPYSLCYLCEEFRIKENVLLTPSKHCATCPYYKKFGFCNEINSVYEKWSRASDNWSRTICTEVCKQYARLFLKELKSLKEPEMNEIDIKLQQNEADIKRLQKERRELEKERDSQKFEFGDIVRHCETYLRIILRDSAGNPAAYDDIGNCRADTDFSGCNYTKTGKNIFKDGLLERLLNE